ncbi:unnamed protein product [Onchocerca ochengi]|uniref:Transposase, MuDR, MULE transposase domain protein n=1 Tax=Onchocerca ochengi TaxID=42157 RepID=A0A182ETF6_ONCOC|nr:unnamed protein product [Onchocerca ochengi]
MVLALYIVKVCFTIQAWRMAHTKAEIANNMYETNELDECIPIFNDDDWEAIFGTEDEIYDEKKSNQISESDAEKPKQNDGSDSLVKLVSAENRAEMSAVYSQP